MTIFGYIIVMFLATFLSWLSWTLVLFRIDPFTAGIWGLFLFYLTLFFSFAGTFSLCGLFVRILLLKNELMFRLVARSFRQSLSYAILFIIALILKSQNMLTWWNIFLLILILTAIECFSLSLSLRREKLSKLHEGEI